MLSRFKPLLAGCSFATLILACGGVSANEGERTSEQTQDARQGEMQQQGQGQMQQQGQGQELSGPAEDVQESAEVLEQLRQQAPELAQRISEAKGVFIIPDYATASLLVGGSGGEGVLMTQQDGQWGEPGFYDIGNIDVGAQAGAAAGSIVVLLMSDTAVQTFHQETDFSLTAQAGLTIINWSAQAPGTTGEGDALVWSDTEGLLAEASVGVGGITWDGEEAREYYNQDVGPDQVLAGNVQNPPENVLQSEFAQFTTGGQTRSGPGQQRDTGDEALDSAGDDWMEEEQQ